ncbi:MAG: ATP-binding protein [Deltaproteobacteria bacterium]|nr:ATP-binding protein [Deltaproteobacteria bacterium]MBW1952731.1 ATP-binding protein [Deltaproteobacteria bacterium]MBW1986364.1 ATP-binding protein [Deltaproteobacteria bacterium]MBW2133757.1 ATP-binding protein [Deltaproteobacteria bacterium]
MGVNLSLSNRPENLALLNEALQAQALEWGLSERSLAHLELIGEELFINIVNHGYEPGQSGQIDVTVEQQGPRLRLIMEDDARPFDLLLNYYPPEDLDLESRPIGGLGICLVRRLAESIVYYRTADNKNRLVVYLPL